MLLGAATRRCQLGLLPRKSMGNLREDAREDTGLRKSYGRLDNNRTLENAV